MKRTLFFIAVFGWCAGLAAHLLSLMDIDIRAYFEAIWLLHIGIFVVFVPAVFELNKNESIKELRKANKKPGFFELYKIIFQNTPNWLKIIAIAGVGVLVHQLVRLQGGRPSNQPETNQRSRAKGDWHRRVCGQFIGVQRSWRYRVPIKPRV